MKRLVLRMGIVFPLVEFSEFTRTDGLPLNGGIGHLLFWTNKAFPGHLPHLSDVCACNVKPKITTVVIVSSASISLLPESVPMGWTKAKQWRQIPMRRIWQKLLALTKFILQTASFVCVSRSLRNLSC